MSSTSRHLKLIAAVAVVLVAISGFSPNRKGGGRSSSSKGGGCSSSSSSSHNSSSSGSSYDGDSDYDKGYGDGYRRGSRYNNGSSNNGSSGRNSAPTGSVTRCAGESGSEAKAVVEVRNSNGSSRTVKVKVNFLGTAGTRVDSGTGQVSVSSRGTSTVDVYMDNPQRLDEVENCEVESVK